MKAQNKLRVCCAAVLLAAGLASAQQDDIVAQNEIDLYIATPVVQPEVIVFNDGSQAYVSRDLLALNDTAIYIVTPPTRTLQDDLIALENREAEQRNWGSRWPTYNANSGVD